MYSYSKSRRGLGAVNAGTLSSPTASKSAPSKLGFGVTAYRAPVSSKQISSPTTPAPPPPPPETLVAPTVPRAPRTTVSTPETSKDPTKYGDTSIPNSDYRPPPEEEIVPPPKDEPDDDFVTTPLPTVEQTQESPPKSAPSSPSQPIYNLKPGQTINPCAPFYTGALTCNSGGLPQLPGSGAGAGIAAPKPAAGGLSTKTLVIGGLIAAGLLYWMVRK